LTKGADTAALSRIKDVAFLLANSATHSLAKPPHFFKGLHHTPSSACQLFIRLRKKRAGYLFDSLLFFCFFGQQILISSVQVLVLGSGQMVHRARGPLLLLIIV